MLISVILHILLFYYYFRNENIHIGHSILLNSELVDPQYKHSQKHVNENFNFYVFIHYLNATQYLKAEIWMHKI